MKHIQVYLTLSVIALFLSSCEDFFDKRIDSDLEKEDDFLVVGATFDNETDLARMFLSYSTGIYEEFPDKYDVEGAKVSIIKPDGSTEEFSYYGEARSRHNFQTNDKLLLEPGGSYTLTASLEGYKDVSATSIMPIPVEIKSVQVRENGGVDEDGDDVFAIDIRFQDPPGKKDFYRIDLYRVKEHQPEDNLQPIYYTSLDPELRRSVFYQSRLFSDATFNGEEKEVVILLSSESYNKGDIYEIQLMHTTEDQFIFDQQLERKDEFDDNPFSSPIPLYTNVNNGAGLFGLSYITKKRTEIK